MHKIITKEKLNSVIYRFVIEAGQIAAKAKPGQFVVVIVDERGERIPLTICDSDMASGAITIIFQVVGLSTKKLSNLNEGDSIQDILGPLGIPTEVKKFGKVICIGGGVGIAEILPIAKAFYLSGNEVSVILGARTKELLILEDEIKKYSKEIFITTDDGTYGKKGFVTDVLKELLEKEKLDGSTSLTIDPERPSTGSGLRVPSEVEGRSRRIDLVYAVGPIPMMKKVAEMTKPYGIKTKVSLNSNMVDATGMCATCRVTVGGKRRFTCVHGPEFDGHLVDFDELAKRQERFLNEEKLSLELYERN